MTHLITPAALADAAAGRPVRLLDVRWRLDAPEGRPAYLAGHLPGAVYVDLEQELTEPGHPERGRHPLPSAARLQAAARTWGLRRGDLVIAYDDNDGVPAARLWWLLHGRGVEVRVLDGGLRGWIVAGGTLEDRDVRPVRGDIVLTGDGPDAAGIDDAAGAGRRGALVDARSPRHYRGAVAGPDPAAGHIPGAVNVPTDTNLDAAGRFRSPAHLQGLYAAAGVPVDLLEGKAGPAASVAVTTTGFEPDVFNASVPAVGAAAARSTAHSPLPDADVV